MSRFFMVQCVLLLCPGISRDDASTQQQIQMSNGNGYRRHSYTSNTAKIQRFV